MGRGRRERGEVIRGNGDTACPIIHEREGREEVKRSASSSSSPHLDGPLEPVGQMLSLHGCCRQLLRMDFHSVWLLV